MNDAIHIYGVHTVEALLKTRSHQVKTLFVQSGKAEQRLSALISQAQEKRIPVQELSRSQLDQLAQTKMHQGIVARCERVDSFDEDGLESLLSGSLPAPAFLLILDQVQDPHNLGACLRTANAMGVHALIAPKDRSVDLTPVVRKVACGAELSTPFVRVTNLARTLRNLQDKGIWIVGTTLEAERSLSEVDLRTPIAIALGSEGTGLRRLTKECCDYLVHIPMHGAVESLNISVACGICLYEVTRQRVP